MSTSWLSAGEGELEINFTLFKHVCLLFCNIAMTGEPMHTASKERIAPQLMFLFPTINY